MSQVVAGKVNKAYNRFWPYAQSGDRISAVCFFAGPFKLENFTFLSIKSLIFTAQKVITHRLKGNQMTYLMSTMNHRH